jgi:peptide/nickel transport system permease protein
MSEVQTKYVSVAVVRARRTRIRISSTWRRFRADWGVFAENRLAVAGLVLILVFGVMAILHPLLMATVWKASIYDPETGFDAKLMHPSLPSADHLLGTDALGRDVLSMLLAATTPAFVVGIAAAVTTAVIGTTMGVVAAYTGGTVDAILMQIADAFLLLPAPLFMVIFGLRFRDIGPALLGLIYGIIAGAGGAAIVMRSHALMAVSKPFIEAARIAGGGSRHIILVHVVPHMLPLTALYMMLGVTGAVVSDAFVAFGGFTRAYLNWGAIIYAAFTYTEALGTGVQWHVLLPPSLALSAFAAAFYFVSRGLHRVADPRLRSR